ncbi:unnamed protein product [Hermetia illucens]|uniref:Uncharacterized protein n=1 Tax=Hermetia illucens TaxID=343691 RepID=A0A7R8V126_HERIL|nr:unnamed protein product [Hermetia illucens]
MGQGLEPKRTDIPLYRSQPQLPSHFFIFEQSKRKKLLTWFSTTRRNFEEMKTMNIYKIKNIIMEFG